MSFDEHDGDDERILDYLLKSLSQTDKGVCMIINHIVEISNKNSTTQCSCTKYFIPRAKYADYTAYVISLGALVKKSITFKVISDDLTGKPKCDVILNTSEDLLEDNSTHILEIKLKQCSDINSFFRKTNNITKLSCNPHTFVTQMLIFLDLIADLLISVCSLKSPDIELEILSGILVGDVYYLYDKYISIWNELNRIISVPDKIDKPIIHSNSCRRSKHLSPLFYKLKEYISISLREICKVKIYYNDFVMFIKSFKYIKHRKCKLKSETCSSTEIQNLSNTELHGGLGNSVTKLEEEANKPVQKYIRNDENAYNNLIDYLLKLLEDQLLADENKEIKKEKHKSNLNSMTEQNKQIHFKTKSNHSISNRKSNNTISTSDIQHLKNIQSCTSLRKNIMSNTMVEMLNIKQEEEKNTYLKSLQNNNPEVTFSDLQKKNKVQNQSESVDTLFIKTSTPTNNLSTEISKSKMFNSNMDKPNDTLQDIFDAGELVKHSFSSIRKESRLDCIFDNPGQTHEKINNNNTCNKETEIKINHELNCGNISLLNNYEFESDIFSSSYEILFSDSNRIENEKTKHDLVDDNFQEIIKITNDESISEISNRYQEFIKNLLKFDNRCNEMTETNLFLDTNYNGGNFGTIKNKMKMDKSSQTIINGPEQGLNDFKGECLIRNSINVATQVVLDTVDISSQTSSTISEFKPTESIHSKLNYKEKQHLKDNSIVQFLRNGNDQTERNNQNPFDKKWPVNAHYIHCRNRYEIKQNISISSNRKCENKNSNYTTEIESYSPTKAKIIHSSVTNICRKDPCVDLTKESRFFNLLNRNYIYDRKMIPDCINSYQLGLSDIDSAVLIQHIQNDYNMFPNDLSNLVQNTVSLHYFKTKNSNDESINWESVISVFTSSNNVNKETSNMLLSLKKSPSTSIESIFEKNQIKSCENYCRLFDINGYPLTNAFGNVLKNQYGDNVVDLCSIDNTSTNVVYDAVLNPSTSCDFNPYLKPTSKNIGIKLTTEDANPLLLFDKYGRPLTDSTGMTLVNNHGRTLLRFNNIGQPVSDHRGGELYTENGILWSFSDENNETIFNKEVETSLERKFIKEPGTNIVTDSFCHVLDKFSKQEITTKVSDITHAGKTSVEWLKAKIQEPLPIIDDFDLTSSKLNVKLELKNINLSQDVKENQSFKLLSPSQVLNEPIKGNSSLFQLKKFQNLDDLQNSKLNSFNIETKNSKPPLDEPSTSAVVNSILSMDWGIKNKENNFEINQNKPGDHLSRIHCSKTSRYNFLSTCSSNQRILNSKPNITPYNYNSLFKPTDIKRDVRAKSKFNIGDQKYFTKNIHYSNRKKININEMKDYVEGCYTTKYLPPNFSFLPDDKKRIVSTDNILLEHHHYMKNDLKSNLETQPQKLLDSKHVEECRYNLKSNKTPKDDKKTMGPTLKTKRKTEVKHRIKDTQNTFRSSKKCNKSKTMKQIHVGNGTSNIFNSCFHAPVQFLLHKLDTTLLCNQKEEIVKNNKHNLGKKLSRFSQNQKSYDKIRTKKKGVQHNQMSVNETFGSHYKKPQLDERSKYKQNKTTENIYTHKQRGDFLSGFDHDKYKLTTPNSKIENPLYDGYNHVLNSTIFSYDEPNKLQSKYSHPNGPIWSHKNSRNSFNHESNVAYLINKYTKSSVPSKVLPSTKFTPCPSLNFNFNSPPKKQFSSLEKNNYFYDSLKTLNRRFVDLKHYESTANEMNPKYLDKNKTFIIPHDKPGNNFFLNLQTSSTNPKLF